MAAQDSQIPPIGQEAVKQTPPQVAAGAPVALGEEAGPQPLGDFPSQVIPSGSPGGRGRFPIKKILMGALVILIFGGLVVFGRSLLAKFKGSPTGQGEATLTYWGLWEDANLMAPILQEYERKNPQVKIEYIKQAKEDYRERLLSSLARGEGPDIFRFHASWVPMLTSNLALLPAEIMDVAAYQEIFYPVAATSLRLGNGLVGIPLMFDGLGLYINEDLFAASGKSPPTTWDDLRQAALALTVRDDQGRLLQSGIALGRTDNVDHWQDILSLMMLQNGVDLASPTGQLAEDVLNFFTVFTTRDRVWDETLPPSTQAFAAGKLAMYFGPSWRALEIKQANPQLQFRVVKVPQLPKASPQQPDIAWASFWVEGVWAKSQNRQEAWRFLNYLSSKTVLQQMYQTAAKTRAFGEPYPRRDMAELLAGDPYLGAYINQAPVARWWYLTSSTFDGPTGLNSRISAYFEDAVNAIVQKRQEPKEVLPTVAQGVAEVLTSYNVVK